MDVLKSEQDRLCMWLSDDPDYILSHSGDILTMNEFRKVQSPSSASEKMRTLLKMITEKGEDACQSFLDILRQHQHHYQQLHQLFSPNAQGSCTPVVADSNSVVTTRNITNTRAKSLLTQIETVSHLGSGLSGDVAGQAPGAGYTARSSSVICADKISGVTIDGDIVYSVRMNSSQVRAGPVDETVPPCQGPTVKMIMEHKVKLIDCLRMDHSFILQHVHARHIVTDRQYDNLKHNSQPEKTVTDLIDQVIGKGQESCSLFAALLKEPEVLRTYPQLKEITRSWC